MRSTGCLIVLGALLTACAGDSDAGNGGGSTGEAGSSSSSGDPSSSTTFTTTNASTSTSTTDPGDSSSGEPGTGSSSTAVEDSSSSEGSSSSTGCSPGELGCPCDEDMCADGLECIDDVCAEPAVCEDDEWGEILTEDTAYFLGEISDDDDDGGTVMGVLTGPDDVDWFRYDGADEFLNTVDPFRTVVSSAPVRFCKFANCPGEDGISDTNFPCQDGAVATTSPDGRPGCCAESLIHVPDAVCGSSSINDDSMAVWIRVDQAEDACVTYAFDYHF
jgi:hypothetical protein